MKKAKWYVLAILSVITLAFIVVFILCDGVAVPEDSSKSTEIFKFIAESVAAWGVLSSALLTTFNTIEANQFSENTLRYKKKEVSFDFAKRFDGESIKEARDITRGMREKQKDLSSNQLIQMIEGPCEGDLTEDQRKLNKRSVIAMFNFFQDMYLSIIHDYSDEEILKAEFSTVYKDIYMRYLSWLDEHMKSQDPGQCENLKSLYDRWS